MPMYPEIMCVPMREELTRLGIEELHTAEEVDRAVKNSGTTMVVVNSIVVALPGACVLPFASHCKVGLAQTPRTRSLPDRRRKRRSARAVTSPDIRHLPHRSRFCATANLST